MSGKINPEYNTTALAEYISILFTFLLESLVSLQFLLDLKAALSFQGQFKSFRTRLIIGHSTD